MNKILFTHIPKTAGTSFRHILDYNFKKEQILRCNGRKSFMFTNNIKVYMGHLPYGMHRYRPFNKFDYITFFRDPVERTISHYFFVLNNPKNFTHEFHKNHSIEEVLNYKGSITNFGTLRNNLQTRFLYGFDALNMSKIDDLKLLNKAKENLKNNYKTFGIQEKFEESVINICNTLKLKYNSELIQSKSKVTSRKEILSENTMNTIIEKNKLDIELYEYAVNLKYK